MAFEKLTDTSVAVPFRVEPGDHPPVKAADLPAAYGQFGPKPTGPRAKPPARRAGSVRRTSSIDMSWPDGPGTDMHMLGRARDLKTTHDQPELLAHQSMTVRIDPLRTIAAIDAKPSRRGLAELIGARGGGGLRAAIDEAVADDRALHTPLALLLDDIAGASLVGGFAWSRHRDDWMGGYAAPSSGDAPVPPAQRRVMLGICSGFRPGSSALLDDGTSIAGGHAVQQVPPLTDPDDPLGWHPLEPLASVGLRRARRLDVWREGDQYAVQSHFRDSMRDPEFEEVAVHEYDIDATIDVTTQQITSLVATPLVLPYPECPGAAPHVGWLVGQPLADLRLRVLEILRGPDCCTHLNDALRALADLVVLLPLVG